jgi:hypothetical protein
MQLYGMDAGSADRILTTHVGSLIRQTTVRERLTPSATDFTKPLFAGVSGISCLPLSSDVRYNPAPDARACVGA